jgi:phosphopantothenoylcysteine decarboxylase/phosphopantothenate--cysteine ligase
MARLLLGVSGGVAAYKALLTARLAVKHGHAVRVIQTPASIRFIGPASFQALTGAPVLTDEFESDPDRGRYPGEPPAERTPISHLALAERADLYLIAPASANTIAKLAHGHADNLLTAAALAAHCPVVVAPAMNDRMYAHPAIQANLETLRQRGITVIPPGEGELASHGEYGLGRLPDPEQLLEACEALFNQPRETRAAERTLEGVRVLVTAGGTREPIDPVRYIGNRSSGRMGFALAQEAAARGARVTLVAANAALPTPPGVSLIEVQTAQELKDACERVFPDCDITLMAAAIADYRPAHPQRQKLKKGDPPQPPPPIELELTDDVIAGLAQSRRPNQTLVAFAAEHGPDAIAFGLQKLGKKGVDAVVVNDVAQAGIGFDSEHNEVTIVTATSARTQVPRADKLQVARAVLDEVERLRAEQNLGHLVPRGGTEWPEFRQRGEHDGKTGGGADGATRAGSGASARA